MNCRINKLTTAILIATGSTIFSNSVLAETFYLSSNTNETQANHYSDLRAVLDRAQEGDTIELLSDFNAPVRGDNNSYLFNFNKKVTIDGKGHKLSFPGANISLDKDVVFKNLSLHINPETSLNNTFTNLGSGTAEAQDAFIFMNGNKLTLDNVKTKQQGDNGFETKLNVVIGAKQGGTNAGNGELTTVNSNPATTVINSITVGSPNDDSTAPVNISLDNVGIKQVNFNNGTTEGSSYTGDINLTLTNKSNAHLINFTSEPENLNLILENTKVLSGDLKLSKVKNLDLKGTSALTIKKSLTVTEKLKVEENANISIGDDFDSDVEASLTATNIDPVSSGTIKLADGSSITAADKNYSNAETYTLRNGEPTTEKRPSANTNVDDIEDEEDDTENTADTEENPNNSTTPPPEVTPENNSSEQPEVQPGSQASGNTDNSSTDNSTTSENTAETQPETPTDSTTDEASDTTSVENQPNSNTSSETKPDSTTESTTSPTEDNSAETSELPNTTEQPGSQASGNTDNSSMDNSTTSENTIETQPETPTDSTTDEASNTTSVENQPNSNTSGETKPDSTTEATTSSTEDNSAETSELPKTTEQPGSQVSGNTDNSSTDNSATSENTIETQPETPTDSTTDEASGTTSAGNQPNSNTSGETKPDSTTESTTSPTENNSAETSELPKTTEQPGSQASGNTDNSSTDNSATSENTTETQPETPTDSTADEASDTTSVENQPNSNTSGETKPDSTTESTTSSTEDNSAETSELPKTTEQPGSQASGNTDNSSTDNSATSESTIETQPETPTDSTTDEASGTTSAGNQPNSNTSGETKPDSTTESTTSPTEDNSAETSELPNTTEQPGSQVSGNTNNSSTDNSAASENTTETQPETPTDSTTDGEQPESTDPNRPIRPSISVAQSTIGISNQILLDHLQSLNRAVIFQNLSFTDTDNLWVVVENSNAKQHSTTNYKMNNKAVTLGYKRQKENLQLGISATYDNARFRNNTSGQLIAKTFQTFMYGNYHSGNYISHFYLGGGLNLIESQQKIAEQTVKAHYRGKILQTGIALSYPINLTSATTLTPHIQANYAWLHTSTYNMSNISIPSQNTSSLRLGTGMRAQISLTEHLSFNALGNVSIETLNQKNKMQGTQWQLSQARPITTNLGAGLTYYFTPKASIEANYQNETRKGYTSHKGNVELSIKF